MTTAAFAGAAEYVAFSVSAAWCTPSAIRTSDVVVAVAARGGGQGKENGEACDPGQGQHRSLGILDCDWGNVGMVTRLLVCRVILFFVVEIKLDGEGRTL